MTACRALRFLTPSWPPPLSSPRLSPDAITSAARLSVLTVGGGPHPRMNQVAIESNVRYVHSLLPAAAAKSVLFADGAQTESVVYLDAPVRLSRAELAFVSWRANR